MMKAWGENDKAEGQKYGYNENAPGVHQRFWEIYHAIEWVLRVSSLVRSKLTTEQSQVRMQSISWRI
jgi:hypothetical protein